MGQPGQQLLPAPPQEPLQRSSGAAAHRKPVALAPDLHRQQSHPHSQRLEKLGGQGWDRGVRDPQPHSSEGTAERSAGLGWMVPGRSQR